MLNTCVSSFIHHIAANVQPVFHVHLTLTCIARMCIAGTLLSTDSYMNLQLDQTKEYIDDKFAVQLFLLFVLRCSKGRGCCV